MSADHSGSSAAGNLLRDGDPDAHGQAALLLVESLMHGLISSSVLTVQEAAEIVDVAAEVKVELAEEIGERAEITHHSLSLLHCISMSLRRELGE